MWIIFLNNQMNYYLIRNGNGGSPPKYNPLRNLLEKALTRHQILILKRIQKESKDYTMTGLIHKLSEKEDIPVSTLRWNIRKLREIGLVKCGSKEHKGVPTRLTEAGKLIFKILEGDGK